MSKRESVSSEKIGDNVVAIAGAVGKYGVAAIVVALPTVVGFCFGVYFLAIGISVSQASLAKVSGSIFATAFGAGLSVLLLYLFTKMKLRDHGPFFQLNVH